MKLAYLDPVSAFPPTHQPYNMETPATRAILCGVTPTVQATHLSFPELKAALCHLSSSQLFARLREDLAACALSLGSAAAAERYGLREDFVIDAVKIYLDLEMTDGKYPYCVSDRFTQTYGHSMSTQCFQEMGLQHGEPTKRDRGNASSKGEKASDDHNAHRSYSTVQKIKAVRDYIKAENPRIFARDLGIPVINIMRWREKMRSVLFQDAHAKNLYIERLCAQARDKFLRDIDTALCKRYENLAKSVTDPDALIIAQAKKIATVDKAVPEISKLWLKCFKQYYHRLKELPHFLHSSGSGANTPTHL